MRSSFLLSNLLEGVCHGFGTRQFSEKKFSEIGLGEVGLAESKLVCVKQVHGVKVVSVTPSMLESLATKEGPAIWLEEEADALLLTRDSFPQNNPPPSIGVITADCLPLLFANETPPIMAATHAGWRGALAGIIEATIDAMVGAGARREAIKVAIGPAIEQDSYEVGEEFFDEFCSKKTDYNAFFRRSAGKYFFNLKHFASLRLREAGIDQIDILPFDTVSNEALFFSHRRNVLAGMGGRPGRNYSIIGLQKP